MSEKEEDLILGEQPGEEEGIIDWFEERADARADIDTAICVWSFIDEIDIQNSDILRWNMKRQLMKTKRQCLQIICKSIEDLMLEKDEDEKEDE